MSIPASVYLATAVNELFAASKEAGAYNATKKAHLTAAKSALATALAGVGALGLGPAACITAATTALNEVCYALEMGDANHNGSGVLVTNQKIGAEYMHTQNALTASQTALSVFVAPIE